MQCGPIGTYNTIDDNILPVTDNDLVIILDHFFSYRKAPRDKVTTDHDKYHTYLLSIIVG